MVEDDLLAYLLGALSRHGPVVLFLACMLETAIFAGLIIPVGALIAVTSMLASRGVISIETLLTVALGGAFVGDQLGYLVGSFLRRYSRPREGRLAKLWTKALTQAKQLLRRSGSIGISLSRGIPFVRTIMPWLAGQSGIPYVRFLLYDIVGVALWGVLYIGGGVAAGEGWRQVAREYGEVAGGIAAIILLACLVLVARGPVARFFDNRRTGGQKEA